MFKFTFFDRFRIPTYDIPKHMTMGDLIFDKDKCTECGICVSLCPGGCLITDLLTKSDYMTGNVVKGKKGIPRVDKLKKGVTLCIACFDCGTACPQEAITIKQNFMPGRFFKRLTQTTEMRYPKTY
jgi:ferredoxin